MERKPCNLILLCLLVLLSVSTSSCNLIHGIINWKDTNQQSSTSNSMDNSSLVNDKKIPWEALKKELKANSSQGDTLNYLIQITFDDSLTIQSNEIPEVIDFLKNSKSIEIRLNLFKLLTNLVDKEEKALSFVKEIAGSDDRILAPLALNTLVNMELSRGTDADDQWSTWKWSSRIEKLFNEAVNKDLYKLSEISTSSLGSLKLLRLTEHYPNSKFTKGAKEYRSFVGEEPYFGAYLNLPNNEIPPVLRTPFNPEKELKFWPNFIRNYPGHPGMDDAMYRLARAYESQGKYEDAILWYYQASQVPDGELSKTARQRFLFFTDLFMTSERLSNLISRRPPLELIPILEYSQAVHLIRENKLAKATSKLEAFTNKYKSKTIKGVTLGADGIYIGSKSLFWKNVARQIENTKKLEHLRKQGLSDESLYEEAAFWFHNELTAYNYLWRGLQFAAFSQFIPSEWKGSVTAIKSALNYETFSLATQNHDAQIGYLLSINLCDKLLKQYPSSKWVEKAKYSIILNYYWLTKQSGVISPNQKDPWKDSAIKNSLEFLNRFPNSSIADDALLTLGELVDGPSTKVKAIEKLLNDYPNSDRKESAKNLLGEANNNLFRLQERKSFVDVGIQVDNTNDNWLNPNNQVVIKHIYPHSSANRAGLLPRDTIIKIDSNSVIDAADAEIYIYNQDPGSTIRFEVNRQGRKLNIDVVAELIKS